MVTIITPDEAGRFRDGETVLVTGNVVSSNPIAEIAAVTVNNRPVQVIDSAGKFFEQVTIAPGRNRFDVSATDSAGDSSTSGVTIAGVQPAPDTIDFSRFSDVSGSITGQYGHTSFKSHTNILFADLAIRNTGTYLADTPLLAGVTNLSDPSVRVRGFDGTTPDGMRYFDFTDFLDDRTLDPGEMTGSRTISFFNPNQIQFSYDLVFLGKLNAAPAITTVPDIEALVGYTYTYDVDAADPDGDTPQFSLPLAPAGSADQRRLGSHPVGACGCRHRHALDHGARRRRPRWIIRAGIHLVSDPATAQPTPGVYLAAGGGGNRRDFLHLRCECRRCRWRRSDVRNPRGSFDY